VTGGFRGPCSSSAAACCWAFSLTCSRGRSLGLGPKTGKPGTLSEGNPTLARTFR